MKLLIPSESDKGLESIRSGHFGHAPYFTLVELNDQNEVISVESIKNIDHDVAGCGGVIDFAISLGIDGVLAAGMGMRPLMRFTQQGVTVYADRTQPIVGEALKLFTEGNVGIMVPESACNHQGHSNNE